MKRAILILFLSLIANASVRAVDVTPLGSLAILEGGRKKPLDSFARESLLKLTGHTTWQRQPDERLTALAVLADMYLGTNDWTKAPIIRCSYRPLKERLGLSADRSFFAYAELAQNAALHKIIADIEAREGQPDHSQKLENEATTLWNKLQLLDTLIDGKALRIVPRPPAAKGAWLLVSETARAYGTNSAPIMAAYTHLQNAYRLNDATAFADAAAQLRAVVRQVSPGVYPAEDGIDRELLYNKIHPFRLAWIVFLFSFLTMLAAAGKSGIRRGFYWLALVFFAAGLGLEAFGFVLRCWIAGRPPVTNMYEVMIWMSFGTTLFAIVFELIYRRRYFALAASAVSVLSLVLADNLPNVLNPTIQPLVPVLQSNYWLTVHVLTITLGYAAFLLAMGIGHIAMGYYVLKPEALNRIDELTAFNYRTIQVGVLFLTAGTILGGLWADKAWGRFWGWDPKETWALISVLCYLVVLHGRYAGWMGNFALNVASVLCFQAIVMAAYGVNYVLGKGLHSYGFGVGGELAVASYVGAELLIVALAVWRFKMRQTHEVALALGETKSEVV